jgi:hypothetical protein
MPLVVKPRGLIFAAHSVRAILEGSKTQTRRLVKPQPRTPPEVRVRPYAVGQTLWVREAWRPNPLGAHGADYAADSAAGETSSPAWRTPLFMPRSASRIELELLSVRIERLHEVSEEDARAEGYRPSKGESARERFADAWQSLNAKRASWSSNPWVWVLEFRRAKP